MPYGTESGDGSDGGEVIRSENNQGFAGWRGYRSTQQFAEHTGK